jgi:CMP-N-acetylneuraminic acid synthetase
MRVICVIPARSGSVGVKDKNIQEINGRPLIGIAVEKALSAPLIDRVILSTDSEKYAKIGRDFGAEIPFIRPAELADSKTRLHYVLQHTLEHFDSKGEKYDAVLSLQASAPLISIETINTCLSAFVEGDLEAVGTGSKIVAGHPYLAKKVDAAGIAQDYLELSSDVARYPRQVRPDLYFFNGCLYIRKRNLIETIDDPKNALGDYPRLIAIPDHEAINIDEPFDLKIAKRIYEETQHD